MLKNITLLANGFSQVGISGGDIHALSFINNCPKSIKLSVVCGQTVPKKRFFKKPLFLNYPSLPFETYLEKNNLTLFIVYLYRILISIFLINSKPTDILLCSSHLFWDAFPLLFYSSRQNTAVFIHHLINEQPRSGFHGHISRWLENIALGIFRNHQSKIITVSPKVTQTLINKYNFSKELIFTSTNGIDLPLIKKIKTPATKQYDLCYCGRLHSSKGIFDLVSIIKNLLPTHPKLSCMIIGDGPDKKKLIELVKQEQLTKNIKLAGYADDPTKIKLLKSSKIFTLASHEEGWGIVIAEALACNLPVVTYRLPEIVSIWKNYVYWITPFSIKSYSKLLDKLLKSTTTKPRQQQFAFSLDWQKVIKTEYDFLRR